VVVAGSFGGYGNTVVIDRGDGLSTLYGHNSELYVRVGQTVQKGEAIAAVGSTGLSTGPHLHFEVRENGNPVDPVPYLR
jgi:murein DD-endopeptidase MepM/ murein hydrolase activator NlpD